MAPAPPLYLDANATMPPVSEARAALAAAADVIGNPSSPHSAGRAARAVLDDARDHIAAALGGKSEDVVLTSGASESNRWLADSVAGGQASAGRALRVVRTVLEHPSVAKPLDALGALVLGVDAAGRVTDPDGVLAEADVVFCTAAHNETGLLPDLPYLVARVSAACVVCVDAAQAVGRRPVLPARVDAVVCSAHKLGAYAGAGALLLRGNARTLPAPWRGGGQEANLRPGTEALVLHAAFGAAAAVVERTRQAHAALGPLRDALEAALMDAWGAEPVCAAGPRLTNTTALVVRGVDGDALRIAIDAAGVAVGFGAACSALVPEPSPSLMALGVSPADARSTVRLSLPPGCTRADVDTALARLLPLAAMIQRSRQRRG